MVCRAFDFDLYCWLGEALNFSVCRADFDLLIQFSFVRRAEQWGRDWYRFQQQLQQLDFKPRNEQLQQPQFEGDYFTRIAEGVMQAKLQRGAISEG